MECTGGERKIQVYKILLYNLLWEHDYYRDVDHSWDSFQQDFGSEQLGKEEERTFTLSQRTGWRAAKSDYTWLLWLRNAIIIFKSINAILTFAAFASRRNNSAEFSAWLEVRTPGLSAELRGSFKVRMKCKKIQIVTHSGPEKASGCLLETHSQTRDQSSASCY